MLPKTEIWNKWEEQIRGSDRDPKVIYDETKKKSSV
jgi:hypothetical protein